MPDTPTPRAYRVEALLTTAYTTLLFLLLFQGACGQSTCRQDSDCSGGQVCILAACKRCEKDSDCKQKGMICQITTGSCINSPDAGTQHDTSPHDTTQEKQPPLETHQIEPTKEPTTTETTEEPTTTEPTKEPITPDGGEPLPETQPDKGCLPPGQFRECYTGTPKTKGTGPCKGGTQICQPDGTWSTCQNEITPQNEVCDGVDNDCNGQIDDKVVELGDPCQDSSKKGECQNGTYTACTNKQLTCTSNTQPTTEICDDGKDNDCDGQVDSGAKCPCKNGETRPCGNDTGECKQGTQTCVQSNWETCNGATQPTTEICDGKDNNCDGQVDNLSSTVSQSCNTGLLGLCAKGTPSCVNGQIKCTPAFQPGQLTEICRNNEDDDCDGNVDEICGPLYSYALIQNGGFFNQKKRGFSSVTQTAIGTYALIPTSSKCGTTPIFLTNYGLYPKNMSYSCNGNDYVVYSGQEQKGSTPNGTKENTNFYAVVPTANETYAVVNSGCGLNKTCSTSTKSGTISVKRIDTGTYEITSSLCNESYRPVFATIRGDQPKAFIATNRYSGKCYVYTRDQNGNGTSNYGFAVWLPNTQTAAFAVITPGNTPTIHTKNDFGDQKARWTVRDFVYSSQSCPDTNNACRRTAVYFPSWANPSAIILNVRDNYVGGASVVLRNVTNPLENILVSVTGNTRGRVSNVRFNILFVQ